MARQRIRFPIRLKLMVLLLSIAVLTIGLFAFLGIYTGRKTLLDSTAKHLASVRNGKQAQVRQFLKTKSDDVQKLAHTPTLKSLLAKIYSGGSNVSNEEFAKQLEIFIKDFGFESVSLVDRYKGLIVSTDKNIDNLQKSAVYKASWQPWVSRSDKNVYISDFGIAAGKAVWLASCLVETDWKTVILIVKLPISELNEILQSDSAGSENTLGLTGESYLVGQDRSLRTPSRFERALEPWYQEIDNLAVKNAFQNQEGVIAQTGYRGKEVLSAYGLVDFRGVRWAVITEMELEEALEPTKTYEESILIYAAVVILLVTIVALIVSRQFVKPIVDLTRATEAHGVGESALIPVRTRDEVGALTETFNMMVEKQKRTEEISLSLRRNIVHDLKTPVTVIKGCAETLEMVDDPEIRQELLKGIIDQSERLLEDLREIITPVGDDWTPNPEPFDVAMLIHKVVKAEQHTARASNHKFEVVGADSTVMIEADYRKIRRVFENLLSNAVKYSPGDSKTVRVTLTEESDCVRVSFTDEGFGLTPEQLESVMNETGRVAETAAGIEGSGFGLDSCRRVLRAHNGMLEAESEKGKGSSFIAVLPKVFTA
jgi:signal transduction histidine kinase